MLNLAVFVKMCYNMYNQYFIGEMIMKRVLALILASIMAASCLACSTPKDDENKPSGETTPTSDSASGTAEETIPLYLDDVPDTVRFDGEDIRFIQSSSDIVYIDVEEDNMADAVVEAVWKRNNLVSERINVNITDPKRTAANNTLISEVLVSVTAGSDEYDVPVGHARFSIALLLENVLYRVDDLQYIDLEKDYWASDVNDNMALYGDHFWVVGDLSLQNYQSTFAIIANSTIWNDFYTGEDLYQTVRDGKWTLDFLMDHASGAYRDLNGNGKADLDDQFGYASNERSPMFGMVAAAGVNYSDYDSEGLPYITINNEHTVAVHEKLHKLMYDTPGVYNEGGVNSSYFEDLYIPGRALFATAQFGTLEDDQVRAMEDDFMFIPMPKYDEAQENYISHTQDGAAIYGILNTVGDEKADITACALELMSSIGSQYVIPVYYDDVLKNKYSRDPETAEMIDLIRSSFTTEFALKWTDSMPMASILSFIADNVRKDSIASSLEKSARFWERDLETLVERLVEIADQYN